MGKYMWALVRLGIMSDREYKECWKRYMWEKVAVRGCNA